MAIKLTLEIKQDPEIGGPHDAMDQMFRRLLEVSGLPAGGFKVTFLAADEQGVERIREQIEDAFEDRPYCIIATLDRKDDKADLRRKKLDPGPTPIERAISAADGIGDFAQRHGVERVTLSSRGRTVELTQQARRNAERMLREMGMGDDDEGGE